MAKYMVDKEIDKNELKELKEKAKNDLCFNFAVALRKLLDKKNISQDELVKKTGCSKGSISGYINAKGEPQIQAIVNIANVLGVSCDYLLGLTEVESFEGDIRAAYKYLPIEVTTLEKLHKFLNIKDNGLYSEIMTYLIEKGYLQTIIKSLRESIIMSYQISLIYHKDEEEREDKLLTNTREFEFNKLIINMYKEIHDSLMRIYISEIKEITVKRADEIKGTAEIIQEKMTEIIKNLDINNDKIDAQAIQSAYVRKLIAEHEGGNQ